MEAPRSLRGSGRGAARDLARRLGLVALTVALLGAAVAPACAAAAAGVAVSGPGVTRGWIEPAELAPGAPGGSGEALSYTLRSSPGEAGQRINRAGMPVREVIRKAGADPDAVGYLTVARPDGTVAYLPGADFAEPPPFEGGRPALISVDVDSTRFLRPLGGDPSEVNAEDNIATPAGEALAIGLHDGNVLSVRAAAAPAAAAAGQAVQLSASAGGGRPGEGVSFRWSFGDGGTAEGASVSHSFAGGGTYEVRATAVGTAGSGGESGPVDVVVGNPPTAPRPGAAPAAASPEKRRPATVSGSGGGRPGRGGGERGGSASGRGRGGAEPGRREGGRDAGAGRRGAENGPSPPRPSASPDPASITSPAATPARRSAGSPSPSLPDLSSPSSAGRAAPSRPPRQGRTVEGTLLANLSGAAAAPVPDGSTAAAGGPASAPGAVAVGRGALPLAALAALGLLAAGVLLEWRGARPRAR